MHKHRSIKDRLRRAKSDEARRDTALDWLCLAKERLFAAHKNISEIIGVLENSNDFLRNRSDEEIEGNIELVFSVIKGINSELINNANGFLNFLDLPETRHIKPTIFARTMPNMNKNSEFSTKLWFILDQSTKIRECIQDQTIFTERLLQCFSNQN